jgi:hypothetical protein
MMGYCAHRFEAVVAAVLIRMVMVMVIIIIDNRIFAVLYDGPQMEC